jgi:hypothetical protein
MTSEIGNADDRAERLARDLVAAFEDRALYWARVPDVDAASGHVWTIEGKMLGLVHSILATLDGCADFPPFTLVVDTPPDDGEEYDQEYAGVSISTMLHEMMSR